MPKFIENKLKAEYGKSSKIPYKVMNKMGAMHGNKETAKGEAMQRKHDELSKFKGKSSNYSKDRPKRKVMNRYA